tara:strand:+ start:1750 stop:1929 length:180 start_codon:yes stop_codon:yes gene_type:complete
MSDPKLDDLQHRLDLRDEAIKELLDAHKALDRQWLANALHRLSLMVDYTPEQAGLERVK